MKLRFEARVSSDSPDAVGRFLVGKFGATSVTRDGNDWFVRAAVDSAGARDANRELLSELRRVERKTRGARRGTLSSKATTSGGGLSSMHPQD
jgi:hypothetical protein